MYPVVYPVRKACPGCAVRWTGVKPGSAPFTSDIATLLTDPAGGSVKEFIVIYDYNGVRKTFTCTGDRQVSQQVLADNAKL